jgi:hypothetical protein
MGGRDWKEERGSGKRKKGEYGRTRRARERDSLGLYERKLWEREERGRRERERKEGGEQRFYGRTFEMCFKVLR